MTKYTIVVDYGKPFEIKVNSEAELKRELIKLKKQATTEEYPFFDVNIYGVNNKDITNEVFKER